MVLNAAGCVWTYGSGSFGQLGHGNKADKLVLTLVVAERFKGAQIVMLAAGGHHSVALGAEGKVWTWGWNSHGQLGHNDLQDRLVPTQLEGEALGGAAAVLVAAGEKYSVAVMIAGALWVWGNGHFGQLGLGDREDRLVPVRVGAEDKFGARVITAACGNDHTLAVTTAGVLWSWGKGKHGILGHNDDSNRLVPTQVEVQHFDHGKIVSATAGDTHSAVVTEHGGLYTWGMGTFPEEEEESDEEDAEEEKVPGGLGHSYGETKFVPTLVVPALLQGARVGCCHELLPLHALAFAMGTHERLGRAAQTVLTSTDHGKHCEYLWMPGELVQRIVQVCGTLQEGRAGELEGVVRLLGGGMFDESRWT